ncbi:MAG: PilZ domain-containing protein [Deltaproteobacteria bacterium]|nr:PilZ domain-containing protein [Deltaproteobacteria bacterium]
MERRGRVRVVASGLARVVGVEGKLAIRDLSASGARLVGTVPLVEGHRVKLELALEGGTATLDADVVRVDRQRHEAAVVFKNASAETRAWIEQCIDAVIERVRAAGPPLVLVHGMTDEAAAALERDLAKLAHAMQRYAPDALTERTCALVVAAELGSDAVRDVLAAVREKRPEIRYVLVFGEQLASLDHDVSRDVDAVLRTPWRIRALAKAIGVESADSTSAMLPAGDDE